MTDGKADRKKGRGELSIAPRSPIKSGEKIVRILDLFSAERTTISAAYAADRLRITASTAYRYLALLSQAGLVEHVAGGGYSLGPAIIEFDWLVRLSDRLLQESRASMRWLLENAQPGAAVLLCRRFRNHVMCVHQERDGGFAGALGYERGRPLPMFSGAASKIILGHLPRPMARALYADPKSRIQIRRGGLGTTCEEFRERLQEMRRTGICVAGGDFDPGCIGIAGPIFDRGRRVVGSITLVLEEQSATNRTTARASTLVHTAAAEITAALAYDQ
jgi:DNA-binding IclR family transcriptional regulator